MNKLVTVLGVAAVATLAGCKDPQYKPMASRSQTQPKGVVITPDVQPAPAPVKTSCMCPPGAKHYTPCECGADDCACVVVAKPCPPRVTPAPAPAPVAAPAPAPAAPETVYTVYVVRNGDYLAKISKKFNVTIASIKRINGLEGDTIRVGQKLKIPGSHDVGPQPAAVAAPVAQKKAAKPFEPYRGPTKEYVVKGGDTLGKIAYSHGCSIRQLKELNGLASDVVRVGQKLKVPADGKAAAAPAAKQPEAAKAKAPAPVEAAKPEAAKPAEAPAEAAPAETPAPAPAAEAQPSPEAPAATYVVQEGDDMTGVSIRFGVSAAAIRDLNNLSEEAQLAPGQIIKLPAEAQQ